MQQNLQLSELCNLVIFNSDEGKEGSGGFGRFGRDS